MNDSCLNCNYVKSIRNVITGYKCKNEDSIMYGEYVDENCTCKKWTSVKNEFNYWRNVCEKQAEQTAKEILGIDEETV